MPTYQSLIAIKLDTFWKFTPTVEGLYFRLRHIEAPRIPIGWVAQVEPIPNTNFHLFYNPQRVNGLSFYELLEFKIPPVFKSRKLAFRQETRTPNNWLIEIEVCVDMPVIDLTPDQPIVNPTIATVKNKISVPITNTPGKLLPVNTTNSRKHATFYNPSTTRNLYIDTDSTINVASAIAKVAPGKLYISDIPGWQGEYWGMLDGTGTTNVDVEEYG